MGRRKKGSKHVRSYEAMLGIWGLCICRQGLCGGANLLICLFYWRIIALQCCRGLCSTSAWVSHIYMYIYIYIYIYIYHPSSASLLPVLHPSPSSQSTRLSSLCFAATSHELAISHMAVYICQGCFPNRSHPLLPPQHPPTCSLCLHLHFFSVNMINSTLSLDSIYML